MDDRPFKRVLCISDTHCGHQVGLTPPEFSPPPINDREVKFFNVRRDLWAFFQEEVERIKPIDILIYNGDAIEGKGERSGGTEVFRSDRKVQCDIANGIIKFIDAQTIRMTYGTASHVGREEDWEDIVAGYANCKIGSHEWYDINGRIFDVKHKIGSSQIPHGRLTPLAREILWNRQWAVRSGQPKADVLLRAHDHYFEHCDHDECLGFIMPSLQGFGSKFGSRECSGTIDMGFIYFDVPADKGAKIQWDKRLLKGETMKAHAEIL